MSLSDRERAEGFHRTPSSAVEIPASERAEGFQPTIKSAVLSATPVSSTI
jgi:hypothetical protein